MELPTQLMERAIKRGTILHSSIFQDIDHGKFFVIVGITNDHIAGFFYVNSNIHPIVEKRPEQFAMQYLMRHADYAFLRYDSFVCATKIQKIPRAKLADTLEKGVTTIVGEMKSEHLRELLDACRQSRLFSKIEKETFFA